MAPPAESHLVGLGVGAGICDLNQHLSDPEAGWSKGFPRDTALRSHVISMSSCIHLASTLFPFPEGPSGGPKSRDNKKGK